MIIFLCLPYCKSLVILIETGAACCSNLLSVVLTLAWFGLISWADDEAECIRWVMVRVTCHIFPTVFRVREVDLNTLMATLPREPA